MRPHTDRVLPSFCVGMENSPDIMAARQIAGDLGYEHHERIFTKEEACSIVEKVVYHMETYVVQEKRREEKRRGMVWCVCVCAPFIVISSSFPMFPNVRQYLAQYLHLLSTFFPPFLHLLSIDMSLN